MRQDLQERTKLFAFGVIWVDGTIVLHFLFKGIAIQFITNVTNIPNKSFLAEFLKFLEEATTEKLCYWEVAKLVVMLTNNFQRYEYFFNKK